MPGYHLIADAGAIPDNGERPLDRMGFLDFLRELAEEEPQYRRFWKVTVVGLEEVLFAAGDEAEALASDIYRQLRAAASTLENRLADVYVVFRGELKRGADLWCDYRGARLPIGRVFGSPPPQKASYGSVVFFSNFSLTHGG